MKTKVLQITSNTILKILSLLLFITAFCTNTSAQISYSYDNNGNRIDPRLVVNAPPPHKPQNKKDSNKVTVYPNPTTGQVSVAISALQSHETSSGQACGHATVYLSDASANVLSTQEVTQSPVMIDLSSYKQGEYYIRVVMCNTQYSNKVILLPAGVGAPAVHPAVIEKKTNY